MRVGRSLASTFIGVVCAGLVVLAGRASAQVDATLTDAFGDINFEVQCPQSGYFPENDDAARVAHLRSVRITVSKPGVAYQTPYLHERLLDAGGAAVYAQCPITTILSGTMFTDTAHSIGSAEIYGPPADGSPVTLLMRAGPYTPRCICWEGIEDVYTQQQQAAAAQKTAEEQAAYQAEQQQQQATAAAAQQRELAVQAQQQAQAQQIAAQREQESHQWWSNFWSTIKTLFWLIVCGSIGVWLLRHWEMFVRWYYELTPHPATDIVNSAVAGGMIDGNVFSKIMAPVPGNRIEREVRAEQARKLAELAHETEAALRRRAEEAQRQVREEAAFLAAQRNLHDATVSAQLAKARADLMEKLAELLKRSAEAT